MKFLKAKIAKKVADKAEADRLEQMQTEDQLEVQEEAKDSEKEVKDDNYSREEIKEARSQRSGTLMKSQVSDQIIPDQIDYQGMQGQSLEQMSHLYNLTDRGGDSISQAQVNRIAAVEVSTELKDTGEAFQQCIDDALQLGIDTIGIQTLVKNSLYKATIRQLSALIGGKGSQKDIDYQLELLNEYDTESKHQIPEKHWDGVEVIHREKLQLLVNFLSQKDLNKVDWYVIDYLMIQLAKLFTNMKQYRDQQYFDQKPQAGTVYKALLIRNYNKMVQGICKGGSVNDKNKNGSTLLHQTSEHGYFGTCLALWLIRKGANINAVDKNNETTLMAGICLVRYLRVQILLEYGVNPHIQNNEGHTAYKMLEYQIIENNDEQGLSNKNVYQNKVSKLIESYDIRDQ